MSGPHSSPAARGAGAERRVCLCLLLGPLAPFGLRPLPLVDVVSDRNQVWDADQNAMRAVDAVILVEGERATGRNSAPAKSGGFAAYSQVTVFIPIGSPVICSIKPIPPIGWCATCAFAQCFLTRSIAAAFRSPSSMACSCMWSN